MKIAKMDPIKKYSIYALLGVVVIISIPIWVPALMVYYWGKFAAGLLGLVD